jgi:hypothetical protein
VIRTFGRTLNVVKTNEYLGISYKGWQYAAPGPTVVWAAENSRGAIFDALKRRETYATTGLRIRGRHSGPQCAHLDEHYRRGRIGDSVAGP